MNKDKIIDLMGDLKAAIADSWVIIDALEERKAGIERTQEFVGSVIKQYEEIHHELAEELGLEVEVDE